MYVLLGTKTEISTAVPNIVYVIHYLDEALYNFIARCKH